MAIGAAIGGALIQGSAAKKAAKAQEGAANKDIALQKETRDLIRNDLAPYREGGYTAQQALDFELGLGARPMVGGTPAEIQTIAGPSRTENVYTQRGRNDVRVLTGTRDVRGASRYRVGDREFATMEEAQAYAKANPVGAMEYGGFTKTPGYDFRLNEGTNAIEAGAAARGGLYSGSAMRALQQYGQDYASSEYNNYLNRLAGRADTGMNAATMSGNASQVAAGNVSNALAGVGNAQAAGYVGVGNAINGGIQNGLGVWQYQKNLNAGFVPDGWTR